MGDDLLDSVHANGGEYAFRLYINHDESKRLMQKCKHKLLRRNYHLLNK